MPFDPISVTGYNANPPEDDGTVAPTNEVTWAGIKTKLNDPVKTAFDDLVTELTTTFDELFGVLMAAAGTDLLFAQPTAPTGWTKLTTHNNKALRLVTGSTGGDAAGSTPFTSVFAARTIAQANLPSYNLSLASLTGQVGTTITLGNETNLLRNSNTEQVGSGSGPTVRSGGSNSTLSAALASGAVAFGGSLPSGGSGTAMDFAVQYVDLIWCSKDALA